MCAPGGAKPASLRQLSGPTAWQEIMTWNHRVIRHPDGTDGIVRSLEMALADANRHPVLDWAEIPGALGRDGGRPD
jgi:hypothetical protein